ncbi:hypothetical protein [Virgisporangium aurantiacum]|uniref:Uncharacterized protein n=1 Tax=Virgisporangium aurantiacum TaxID=175570 RepID=A0A8J4E5P1_9ACTN|nr:hypothetical protein [Virgisporangium aurantiacum]GIJ62293.1 hypothetical protein Vau01_098090 [Virgisporangium aurantiacum]
MMRQGHVEGTEQQRAPSLLHVARFRSTELTIDDIIRDSEQVLLRFGDPPTPVPEPVASLLLKYLGQRTNMRTATNRDSRWLSPDAAPANHSSPTLSPLIHKLGIPTTAGRTAAIRQHVLDMPAPIVATAPGYHQITAARLAADAGTTWANYAPWQSTDNAQGLLAPIRDHGFHEPVLSGR